MFRLIGKFARVALAILAIAVIVGGVIGYVVGHRSATPVAPAPAVPITAPAVQWYFNFGAGSPVAPAAPVVLPPVPTGIPAVNLPAVGSQTLLTGLWDYCCGETTQRWPITLEIRSGGMLYATEYRDGESFEEIVAGPGVLSIINSVTGWNPGNGGGWTPYLVVVYQDTTGVINTTPELDTRNMFGR